jgi:NAD(P)-dependent dehydrogenase (short-subunit alcohol dehydrogenase family)
MRLDGKVAVITGGTSGIGARTAELFVQEGARVVIAGRRRDKGERVAAALGDRAHFVRADVGIEADIRALIEDTARRFGRLDCVFNNAGTLPSGAGIADIDLADFDAAIALHVRGALAAMKHAAKVMIGQRSGSIINMASIVGIRAGIGSLAYSTAKAAVVHLTRCAAVELGEHGIRVNSLSPGPISTGIFGKGSGLEESVAEREIGVAQGVFARILPTVQPLPRMGTTDDVAEAALFLASDASSFVAGHDLVVDGGSTAGRPASVLREQRALFARAFRPLREIGREGQ